MIVRLNGDEIYSGEIHKENPDPIVLPKTSVNSGKNTLEFESERVGWVFWRIYKTELANVQVTADVKDTGFIVIPSFAAST